MNIAVDLSHFFNKYVIFIPSSHPILIFRVFLWGLMGCLSVREFYHFVRESNFKKLSSGCWLAHFALALEYMIFYKFSGGKECKIGIMNKPFPDHVVKFWTGAFTICALMFFYTV